MYDFTCIDFETANNNMNSACSVGIVAVSGSNIVKSDYFLIKPLTEHFRHENTEVHGITFEMVADSPQFPEIWAKLAPYFASSQYIIAHNAQFDMSVLHETAAAYKIEIPDFIYLDSISIASKIKEDCGNSLMDCAKYFDIPVENHHNSLEDARACAEIVIRSINQSRYKNISSFVKGYYSINPKLFSALSVSKTMKGGRFESIKISEITAATSEFNTAHPLFGKNCVLTGELESIGRKDAMQKIVDVGGINKSSVSKKTDYLIVGTQDKKLVGDDGLSTKEEKAYELIKQGADIKIINEDEFLRLLNN